MHEANAYLFFRYQSGYIAATCIIYLEIALSWFPAPYVKDPFEQTKESVAEKKVIRNGA